MFSFFWQRLIFLKNRANKIHIQTFWEYVNLTENIFFQVKVDENIAEHWVNLWWIESSFAIFVCEMFAVQIYWASLNKNCQEE